MWLCRDNHAVSSRKSIDCQHTQTRHTINKDSIIILFHLIDAGFQHAFTAYGIDEPYFQADSSMLDGRRSTPSSWCRMLLETSTGLSSIMSCIMVESVLGKSSGRL